MYVLRTINHWFKILFHLLFGPVTDYVCYVVPSNSLVSLPNIITFLSSLAVLSSQTFVLSLAPYGITSAIKKLFFTALIPALQQFPDTRHRHFLEWNPSWLYHRPFRAPFATSLLITQSWCNRGIKFTAKGLQVQFYLKSFLHRILNSSVFSFQEFISLNVSTFLLFLCWYVQFIKFLQVFIYLSLVNYPQGICFYLHNTLRFNFLLFGTYIIFFSALNGNNF